MPPKRGRTSKKGSKKTKNTDKVQAPPESDVNIAHVDETEQCTQQDDTSSIADEIEETAEKSGDFSEDAARRKRKLRDRLNLTPKQEDDMANWLKDNSMIYNKGSRDYKDKEKKNKLWEDKAKELDITVDDMKVWYESMRTRYGRLISTKSGDGTKDHSERDLWIIHNFGFLRSHIHRMPSRQAVSLKSKFLDSSSQRSETPNILTDEEDDDDVDVGEDIIISAPATEDDSLNSASSTTQSANKSSDARRAPNKKKTGKSTTGKFETEILNQLSQRAENSRMLQSRIEEMMEAAESSQSSRVMWGRWMSTMMTDIDEDLWDSYMHESFKQLMWYREESRKMRKQAGTNPQLPPLSRSSQQMHQSHTQFQAPYDPPSSNQRCPGQMYMPSVNHSLFQPTYHGQSYIPSSRYTSPTLSWDTPQTSDLGLGTEFTQGTTQQQRQTETQSSFIQLLDLPTTTSATIVTTSDLINQDSVPSVRNTTA